MKVDENRPVTRADFVRAWRAQWPDAPVDHVHCVYDEIEAGTPTGKTYLAILEVLS